MLFLLAMPAGAGAACTGDCNGDGSVDIGELIRGVNIALGSAQPSVCTAMDTNGSGSVSISELIAAVNVALAGCPVQTPTAIPTATPTGGVDPIFPADYRDSFIEVRDCRLSIEHGGVNIRVLANAIAAEPYLRDQNPLPVGSVVIKEEYDGSECRDADLVRWRVMLKEEPGFDPEDGDWHWQWVDAPSRHVRFDDKDTCIGCHLEPACLARDYMCTIGQTRGRLRPALENLPAALLSVAGTGPKDVYAVGGDPEDGRGPLVLHYDGTGWDRLDTSATGATGALWWISVTPIGNAFYLSGDGGLILRYDLTSRQFRRDTTPGSERIYGTWGASPSDIWAVGAEVENPDTGGVIWHYDGENWTNVDLSGVRQGGIPQLFKVWGRSSDDIYAVGFRGIVLHWNGDAWSEVTTPNINDRQLFTVHGNAGRVGTVGGFFAEGLLLEREGAGDFLLATPSGSPQLNGVFYSPDDLAVAVGNALAVATRDGDGWITVDEGNDDQGRDFHAVWVDSEDGIWAVGGDLADLINGVLRYGGPQLVSGTVRP